MEGGRVFFFKCDDGVFSALKEKGGVMERLDILTRCLRRQMGRAKKKFVHPVFTINGRLSFFFFFHHDVVKKKIREERRWKDVHVYDTPIHHSRLEKPLKRQHSSRDSWERKKSFPYITSGLLFQTIYKFRTFIDTQSLCWHMSSQIGLLYDKLFPFALSY